MAEGRDLAAERAEKSARRKRSRASKPRSGQIPQRHPQPIQDSARSLMISEVTLVLYLVLILVKLEDAKLQLSELQTELQVIVKTLLETVGPEEGLQEQHECFRVQVFHA